MNTTVQALQWRKAFKEPATQCVEGEQAKKNPRGCLGLV
jgi:hypothetical protein